MFYGLIKMQSDGPAGYKLTSNHSYMHTYSLICQSVSASRLKMDPGAKHSFHGNSLLGILTSWGRHHADDQRNVLDLNVLLLGDRQSGKSSVGNALIGGQEFQTGPCLSGVSMTTECRVLRRTFPRYFRRQGAESDLVLRVVDTPPQIPHPNNLHKLCPEGVHVLAIVVRADLVHKNTHLQHRAMSLLGPEWRHHALLVLTHTDQLKKAGLHPSIYLTQVSDWLRSLAEEVTGGVWFLDNSCDWPSIRGRSLRDQVLHLSAINHHKALNIRTEVSL